MRSGHSTTWAWRRASTRSRQPRLAVRSARRAPCGACAQIASRMCGRAVWSITAGVRSASGAGSDTGVGAGARKEGAGDESREAAGVEGRLRRTGRRWGVGARWLVRFGDGVSRLYIVIAPASRKRESRCGVVGVLTRSDSTRFPDGMAVDRKGTEVKHRDTDFHSEDGRGRGVNSRRRRL